jgi:hypothetical protein
LKEIDPSPFEEIVGERIVSFIFENAPQKVTSRVAKALYHYDRASNLVEIDEEMGAIRLIAAEEELVVAIFEWLKLNDKRFPEHRDFVRKFKNHIVKLAFYPTLVQFRFILEGMIKDGFTMDGLEDVINWGVKPVVEGKLIKLAIIDNGGKEIIRHNPLAIALSRDDIPNSRVVDELLQGFRQLVKNQRDKTLRAFLLERADYRNQLLYASDAGSIEMGETLSELIPTFQQTYHDLLWALAILIGAEPSMKQWGLVAQFIDLYRRALIEARVLREDNSLTEVQ